MSNTSDLSELLYDCCVRHSDLLADVVDEYLLLLDEQRRSELREHLTSEYGEQ